jgi:hypothetical protein
VEVDVKYFKEPAQRIGWLFVLATAAGVSGAVMMSSTLGDDDLIAAVHSNQGSLIVGEMLIFVMLAAMVGTAVLLAPILKAYSETLALSYVLARTLEVVMISIGLVAGLLLIPLSWDVAAASGGDAASAAVLAESLKSASDWTGYLGAQMIFSISALVLNLAFIQNGLIPRWLSLWGLIGVPLAFASGLLVMFESLNSNASMLNLLIVPLAIQELVMALWLIAKGFADDSSHDPGCVDVTPR